MTHKLSPSFLERIAALREREADRLRETGGEAGTVELLTAWAARDRTAAAALRRTA